MKNNRPQNRTVVFLLRFSAFQPRSDITRKAAFSPETPLKKAGKDYKKHAALDKALAVEEWGLEKGMVFCSGNVEEAERTLYLPWYMVMFFKQADFSGVKVSVDVDF